MKNEKIKNNLKLEIYNKGGSQWYCDYYFYNGLGYEKGTTKAGGYGYDKHSTATSEAINKFKFLYKFKNGLQWDGMAHVNTKQGKRIYGIYKDKHISYGIGIASVMNCLNAFNNIKVVSVNYGQKFDYIHLEITTTKNQLQKEFKRNQKIIDDKKTSKEERKRLININKKILEWFD